MPVFVIDCLTPWNDTSTDVVAGEVITFSATGTIYITGDFSNPETPDGTGVAPGSGGFLDNSLWRWSLIGKIGVSGTPFQIGVSGSEFVTLSGRLYLSINDDIFFDNHGSWSVDYSITEGQVAILARIYRNSIDTNLKRLRG